MNKIPVEGQYEYFRCINHDFNNAYKMVNDYVAELYVLPKRLIDNTAPVLNKFISDYTFSTDGNNIQFEIVLEFIHQLDEFTAETQTLYKEHKGHTDKSKTFLKKLSELNQKCSGRIVSEYAMEYIDLTPELTELHEGLKRIKCKADKMVEKLEKLELRWKTIRVRARQIA